MPPRSRTEVRPRNYLASLTIMGAVVAAFAGCLGYAGVALSAAGHAAGNAGWYTPDQAAHGHITFNSYCAECHRPDLKGALGPALIGNPFLQAWLNKPVGDLFQFEHSRMPANNPGAVPDAKMWNITAYILQKNGFPAGATPLGAQAANRTLAKP
jgi:S-disulfanyl-L-cysteine oxidoreductase SoxD